MSSVHACRSGSGWTVSHGLHYFFWLALTVLRINCSSSAGRWEFRMNLVSQFEFMLHDYYFPLQDSLQASLTRILFSCRSSNLNFFTVWIFPETIHTTGYFSSLSGPNWESLFYLRDAFWYKMAEISFSGNDPRLTWFLGRFGVISALNY